MDSSRVCSPWVDTRAAKSTSESWALERTNSTVTSERNSISATGKTLPVVTLRHTRHGGDEEK